MTPSDTNSGTYVLKVATPAFSKSSGTYWPSQNVAITCATPGATIHYTTNGIDPTESDPAIAAGESVLVDHTLTLKAMAWKGAMTASTVAAANYTISFTGEVIVGTGTTAWAVPLTTSNRYGRTQAIYLASELGASCEVSALALYVTTAPGQTMNSFTIRMKHTTLSTFDGESVWESSGWTTVYQANQTISTTGWVPFTFSTPFPYDGVSNLMVDISFANSYHSTTGRCRSSSPGGRRSLLHNTDLYYGEPLSWSERYPRPSTAPDVPNIKLTVQLVNRPVCVPNGADYDGPQNVQVTCATAGTTMHYTTNGAEPTESDTVIESGGYIPVTSDLTLKVKAFKASVPPSLTTTEVYRLIAGTPVLSYIAGTYNSELNVVVTCATADATIHYTVRDTTDPNMVPDPTESDPVIASGASVLVDHTLTLKAKAWKTGSGLSPSSVKSATYTLIVATPVLDPNAGAFSSPRNIAVSCATPGATMRYTTNGMDPNSGDPVVDTNTVLVDRSMTLKVRAWKGAMVSSSVAVGRYVLVGPYDVNIGGGSNSWSLPMLTSYHDARTQTIYLADELRGPHDFTSLGLFIVSQPGQTMNQFTIRMKHTTLSAFGTASWDPNGWTTVYQANEAVPPIGWTFFTFTTPFSYNGDDNLMVDLSFNNISYAYYSGACTYSDCSGYRTMYGVSNSSYGSPLTWSGTSPYPYMISGFTNIVLGGSISTVAAPSFSPGGGTYNSEQNVVVTCATAGATIHYTTSGADPTESDPIIASGGSVYVDHSLTLKAKAWKSESLLTPSAVRSATYVLVAATPTIDPHEGPFQWPQTIAVGCATPGATIRYTTNGADPNESDPVADANIILADQSMILKVRAWKEGFTPSSVITGTYIVYGNGVVIGNGPYDTMEPLGTQWHDSRTQIIYLAGELGGSRIFNSLGLYVSGVPGQVMNRFTIRMKHTSLSSFDLVLWESEGWTTVYQADRRISCLGWAAFDFSTPFGYDGTSNLMLDISFNNSSGSYNGSCRHFSCSGGRTASGQANSEYGDPLNWSLATPGGWKAARAMNIVLGAADANTTAPPTFSPGGGVYTSEQNVVITCMTEGAEIHYTLDGRDPNESDPVIASGGSVLVDCCLTLKAKAFKAGFATSATASATYTIQVTTPALSAGSGTYNSEMNVLVTCRTAGAEIHYTTNGVDPTESDTVIASGGSITVDHSLTLKARAFKAGWASSAVTSATYNLVVAMPVFSPDGGTFSGPQNVTITCATPGATIHYTTNGFDPTELDLVVASGGTVPVAVEPQTILKARAFKPDFVAGTTKTGVYRLLGKIVHVSTAGSDAADGLTWETAKATLEAALGVVGPDDEIWVASGTYYPTSDYGLGIGDRGKHFRMKNGVGIYGGFEGTETSRDLRNPAAHVTRLSGDIGTPGDVNDNCYHVFYHPSGTNLDSTSVLDSFTITGGRGYNQPDPPHCNGGGMYNYGASPTITNCVFDRNKAGYQGGAIYNHASSPVISRCVFTDNDVYGYGAGIYSYQGIVTVSDSVFLHNHAEFGGAGIQSTSGGLVVNGCRFTGNGDGGIHISSVSPVDIRNCIFAGNTAAGTGAGFYSENTYATLNNCSFVGNHVYETQSIGSAAYGFNGVELRGCTLYMNESYAAYKATLTNCIVWENGSQQLWPASVVTFSDVQGGWAGEGNINLDPMLYASRNLNVPLGDCNDVRLMAGSPCIDSGSNAAVPAGMTTDVLGNPRIVDGDGDGTAVVDMGAYERQCVANPAGDVSYDCGVEFADYALLEDRLGQTGCTSANWWCYMADVDQSGAVDILDMAALVEHWLEGVAAGGS